ncbi:MAG: tocopherol cyclase family protein [Candidatus Nanopelagicales bacterium]
MSRQVMHPAGFHGARSRPYLPRRRGAHLPDGYFEGWYSKLISADRSTRLAVIPGVFTSTAGDIREAFVQVLDGSRGTATYHSFPVTEFQADSRIFDVQIAGNHLSDAGALLDLPDLRGEVRFRAPLARWPVTVGSPGAMGWYAWVPTMECYHAVLSLDHGLAGSLELGPADASRTVDLTDGRGYLEKDWGRAFPQAYVWLQCNHFELAGVSLMASVALIPWRGRVFRGFIAGLLLPPGVPGAGLHRFATYTRARSQALSATPEGTVEWVLQAPSGARLELRAQPGPLSPGVLHAPVRTQMHQRVAERLDATIEAELRDEHGRLVFTGSGSSAGLEAHGDLTRLLAMPER